MSDRATLFPANENTPGQTESRRAYRDIEARLSSFPWFNEYQSLRAQGRDWRKAVYIAWEASPGKGRQPETQRELAISILGLKDDRSIRNWRKKDRTIDQSIMELAAAPLLRHRHDIYKALIASAVDPDPKSHADRKLALEMLGDYKPAARREVTGRDGEKLQMEHSGEITYSAIEARNIFDILAAVGAIESGADDTET